ncbi:3-hydroxyacyl-CoA dehydrogenase NAD-binding domain-containing protein [Novosphingobium mangrovi (ex Hu et al. 2023)]|uniref:3-hydroxyacyl-CoA dehydrogenase NAD-binding domain-containing protein n=1 Tax=Novosphingobium mangrovi (ex Hu et al. 2023) TaxID=2930094 RepID=A0ABT0A7Z2_9SPHN|nr:3-hydroxyacyl-CoA dehydrogenase NAD-binding domain-containing protein [Novosphingobium mangrovi (ex Hu et al. 2023)]MCJ1959316.1 3-hydroxyacyl-CoA dehydrogenase NAD-binding domain-containing protein [Novosphingobium mangrovi (ex Hu et al. 2023)]
MASGQTLDAVRESAQSINDVTTYARVGTVAVITIDSPPVNALGGAVRRGLMDAFARAADDSEAHAVVLACAGRTFIAGADIREFDAPDPDAPDLLDVLARIDACPKPTVAAIHGTALGGGLETALCCHYRVATPSAKVGLPEVALGLLPGAGGTQRLPRIVGAQTALEMMVLGKPVAAAPAHEIGLIDTIVEGDLLEGAIAFARNAVLSGAPPVPVRERSEGLSLPHDAELFARFRADNARAFKGYQAPENIVRAVEAAVTLPFEAGMRREAELFQELFASRQSAALRYLFFAERQTARVPDLPTGTPKRPIAKVGVIGAGTMGSGIAMNFLSAGIPVTLVEQEDAALERGVAAIRRNYEISLKKGKLTPATLDACTERLHPSLDMADLCEADLIIEAVFEKMTLKQEIFARLDGIARPGAILATNTSFLDINAIAAATSRPGDVIGLHFFSPANVMRLLEVVRGSATRPDVVATAMGLARTIAKIPVLSGVCDGFIANRMMTPRMDAAQALILEGPLPWEVDKAMVAYGFAMGPFAMLDLVGLDVIGWDPATSTSSTVTQVLCETGRWGQKRQAGFYDYDATRRPSPSPVTEALVREFQFRAETQPRLFSGEEIVERLLLPVVNEGARILEEGIALRASDIDVALVMGYGWPPVTGGPMFWADTVGLEKIIARLEAIGETPAPLLRRLADDGAALHTWPATA